jgi:hypothetical protein
MRRSYVASPLTRPQRCAALRGIEFLKTATERFDILITPSGCEGHGEAVRFLVAMRGERKDIPTSDECIVVKAMSLF